MSIIVDSSIEDYPNNLWRGKEVKVILMPLERVQTWKPHFLLSIEDLGTELEL